MTNKRKFYVSQIGSQILKKLDLSLPYVDNDCVLCLGRERLDESKQGPRPRNARAWTNHNRARGANVDELQERLALGRATSARASSLQREVP